MRQAWWVRAAAALTVAAWPLAATGCTTVVPGAAAAAPPPVQSEPATPEVPEQLPDESEQPQQPAEPRSGLDGDVLPDECLLDAAEFGALVGQPVQPPTQGTIVRSDGSQGASCVAMVGTEPVAMINVYAVRGGSPGDYVRAGGDAGRRALPGIGDAAVVIDTVTGPTLQLASPQYLVTILVSGTNPPDDAWRTAAETALSRLPG